VTARHVYVHVPFCARRCSYCDFSIAVRRNVPIDEYLAALRTELSTAERAGVSTIYFGGGTPSRLGAGGVQRMLDIVRQKYEPDAGAEITLEANPEDVTEESAAAWLAAGVNRLSLGAQSFDDTVLAWMHRAHDSAGIVRAFTAARDAGFTNISLDLIFALPDSLQRDWPRDLAKALELGPEHISLYGLTVEPATPLARWRDRGAVAEAPEESYEREYLLAHDLLARAGYSHYEVSNFARAGRESRHNGAYWTLAPYAGHGPAAHSWDGERRMWNEPVYTRWRDSLARGEEARTGSELLTGEQSELERVYLGLRTLAGVHRESEQAATIERWIAAGWGVGEHDRVTLTPRGWLRLDALALSLTGVRSPCNV
jgi:oxygen-independent coproporphyrinogen-3 oxidase